MAIRVVLQTCPRTLETSFGHELRIHDVSSLRNTSFSGHALHSSVFWNFSWIKTCMNFSPWAISSWILHQKIWLKFLKLNHKCRIAVQLSKWFETFFWFLQLCPKRRLPISDELNARELLVNVQSPIAILDGLVCYLNWILSASQEQIQAVDTSIRDASWHKQNIFLESFSSLILQPS